MFDNRNCFICGNGGAAVFAPAINAMPDAVSSATCRSCGKYSIDNSAKAEIHNFLHKSNATLRSIFIDRLGKWLKGNETIVLRGVIVRGVIENMPVVI